MNTHDLYAALTQKGASSIVVKSDLEPLSGLDTPVAPPTYSTTTDVPFHVWGRQDNERFAGVTINGVAAESNIVEACLARVAKDGELDLFTPRIEANLLDGIEDEFLAEHPREIVLSVLELPHNVSDARFRDCEFVQSDGSAVPFRETDFGKAILNSTRENMTGLLTYAPTVFLVGTWDTHAPQDEAHLRRVTRQQLCLRRAMTAEIIGHDVTIRPRTFTLTDPLGMDASIELRKLDSYYGKFELKEGKEPSGAGLAAVIPSEDDRKKASGVFVKRISYWANISLAALRRLHFPVQGNGGKLSRSSEIDGSARAFLASLGILGLALRIEDGFDLRSGCDLRPIEKPKWTIYGPTTEDVLLSAEITPDMAYALYEHAYEIAKSRGFSWESTVYRLRPMPRLKAVIEANFRKLRDKSAGRDNGNGNNGSRSRRSR